MSNIEEHLIISNEKKKRLRNFFKQRTVSSRESVFTLCEREKRRANIYPFTLD